MKISALQDWRKVLLHLVGITLLGVAVFVVAYWLIPLAVGLELVRFGSKPLFYAVFLLVAVLLLGVLRPLRLSRQLLLLSLLGSLVLLLQHSYSYRVLSDEYVIPAQAKSLHEYSTSDYPLGTFPAYGELKRQDSLVDKRPPSFSILLSLLHDLSGYRPGNVFILNTLLGFLLIALLLGVSKSAERWAWYEQGAWVLTLVGSLPLFAMCMTGAGLDLFNSVLIFLSGWLAWKVLSEQATRWVWAWLGVSWILFNCRYESILFVLSVAAVILLKTIQLKRLPAIGALYAMPLLLMPYVLRHRVFDANAEISWQTDAGQHAFGLSYIFENVGHAIDYLFIPNVQSSGSAFLAWLGLVSLLILAVRIVKTLSKAQALARVDQVLLAYGAVILINFLLLMSYHWGRIDELEVSRLTLPLFLLFGASIYRVAWQLAATRPLLIRGVLAVGLLSVFIFALPHKAETLALKGNYHAEVDAWALEQVRNLNQPNPMVISNSTLFWYLYEIASLNPETVKGGLRGFEFHRSIRSMNPYLVKKVKLNPLTGAETILAGAYLDQVYQTQVIAEMTYKPYHMARLLRITGVKEPFAYLLEYTDEETAFYQRYPIEYWFFQMP